MGIFDLVFIVSVLLSLATLLLAAGLAIARRFRTAALLLGAWVAYVVVYLALVLITSVLARPRQLAIGENVCFDDWCIAVDRIEPEKIGVGHSYRIAFTLSSRAKTRHQREHNLAIYLIDVHGLRYDPREPDGQPPFDAVLAPGDAVRTTREFDVPVPDAQPRLVITHEGGFPIGWLIIGHGPFFKGSQLPMPSPPSQ